MTAPEPEKVLYKHIKEEETVFDHRKTSKGKGRESSVDEQVRSRSLSQEP